MPHRLLPALLLLAPLPAQAQSPSAAAEQVEGGSAFAARAGELVGLLKGEVAYGDYFDAAFRAAVPEPQFKVITAQLIAQYGQPVSLVEAVSANGRAGTARVQFEKGIATFNLVVGAGEAPRVSGLRLTGFGLSGDGFAQVAADLAALPGDTGFLVADVDGEAVRPIAGAHADAQFAIGSTFKLYVLAELAAQVRDGKRRWADVVPLTHASFSSAATANWPRDTPVTLQTLANWMISVSDNGATDTLIHLLGRAAIERRMARIGHSAPSRNTPFLTTVEAFALKGDNFAAERAAFLAGDDAAQRRIIEVNSDKLVLANVDGVSFGGGPRFIDSLEWFASPTDLARAMGAITRLGSPEAIEALAINAGIEPGSREGWSYVGYKGGSELGVLSMTVLGKRESDGKWRVVTASWNNRDAALSTESFVAIFNRLARLAAQ